MQGASVAGIKAKYVAAASIALLLACIFALLPALAQSPPSTGSVDKPLAAYFRETWTTREGLPHNQVNAIAQTPEGYLWFATWEGLVRYDGQEFLVYDRSNTPALRDNGVRSVRASPDGAVVVGTSRGGVSIKRGDAWHTWTVAHGLAQNEIMDAVLDRHGRLWVATGSSGVDRIDGGEISHYNASNGLPSDVVYGLQLDRDDSVWVASAAGLAHIANDRVIRYGTGSGLPNTPVFCVYQDRTGRILVGTEKGVYRREGERFVAASPLLPADGVASLAEDAAGNLLVGTMNNGLLRLTNSRVEGFTSQRGLPNNRVSSLLIDREGSIWAGTNAGVLSLSDAPFVTWNSAQGMSDDYVRALAESGDGTLWIGTSGGLDRWRGGKLDAGFAETAGLQGVSVLSLLEDRDGSLLVGTYTDGLLRMRGGKIVASYDNAHGMPGSNFVRALAQQADGTVWIGTTRGLVRMHDGKFERFGVAQGLPRDFIKSVHVASDNSVWVGTSNGVARIVGNRVHVLDMHGVGDAQNVFDFHEDADGTLWLATDNGLLRYRKGRLQALGAAQGLPIDALFAVVDDGIGSLWLTSNRGVMRLDREDIEAVLGGRKTRVEPDRFGEADGLVSSQCNGGSGPAALRDARGRIWVATARGAAMVDPETLHAFHRTVPPVVIEQILVDDRPVPLQPSLRLPAGSEKLEIRYASVSFRIPRFVRYRLKLDGLDSGWIDRGNQRSVQYTNLGPGHYRFQVNASAPSVGQGWSGDITSLDVDIQPHVWQSVWFRGIAVLVALLLLADLYRWRVGLIRERANALESVVDQRTQDLREQADRLMQADREKTALLARIREQSEAFERQAREDALTGLANRRGMDEDLARAFASARKLGRPISFALLDIDDFKRVNDQYSHTAGDLALRAIAQAMRDELADTVRIARWGGEEFALLFDGVSLEQARPVCERLRVAIERMDCSAFAKGWKMTISGGVAERAELTHYERLVNRADTLLYQAKREGRNRICG